MDKVRLVLPFSDENKASLSKEVGQEVRLLSVELLETDTQDASLRSRFLLKFVDNRWCLFPPASTDTFGRQPLSIDFVKNARFNQPMNIREPLAKAVGLKANRRPLVIDLTSGLGRDSWALASTGCRVIAYERHPLVHFLLADALRRARSEPKTGAIATRIHLYAGDAREHWADATKPDENTVWLLDPMFPERQKSALVKKDMRIFHELVGGDEDADGLLEWARRQPGSRCVVKRPPDAMPLGGLKPSMSIASGRVRFDCYINPSHPETN